MKRGDVPSIKQGFSLASFIAVVFLLVMFSYETSKATTNPCWQSVLGGLKPLDIPSFDEPVIVLDDQCVEKFVFTTSVYVCELTCNGFSDDDKIRECVKKCKTTDDEVRSYIIAMPKESGSVSKAIDAHEGSDVRWFFGGNPHVSWLRCDLTGVNLDSERCIHNSNGWICTPPEDGRIDYNVTVSEASGGRCTIERR